MKQVTKLGVLLVLLSCSLHTAKLASLKGTKLSSKLKENALAQSQCNIPGAEGGEDCYLSEARAAVQADLASGVLDCNACVPGELVQTTAGTTTLGQERPAEERVVPLGSGQVRSHEVSALASQLTETNEYDDHKCQSKSTAHKCEDTCESKAAFGCGCRKRTVCLEGDITYRNIRQSSEKGSAKQERKACEEAITTTTTALTSVEAPQPCVSVQVCP